MAELRALERDPPPGIACYPLHDDRLHELEASCVRCASPTLVAVWPHPPPAIDGSADTPYDGGTCVLRLSVPQRYPLEPPKARFVTPIYHPNIDQVRRAAVNGC